MTKWLLIILLMMPFVYGAVECQWSDDNATWKNTTYLSTDNQEALQFGLQQDTKYYFRCKNESTNWAYLQQRTLEGVDAAMSNFTIVAFLAGINLIAFFLPFKTNFSKSQAANYVIKRLVWISAMALLWFNMTIIRTIASNKELGLDNFLLAIWWVLTLGMFIGIFLMVYFMVVGATKLIKESQMRKRMGDDYSQ